MRRGNAGWGLKPEGVGQKEESSKNYGASWVCLLKSHGEGHVQVGQDVLCRVETSRRKTLMAPSSRGQQQTSAISAPLINI